MTYKLINSNDPSLNFEVSGDVYEEALENALHELNFEIFRDWSKEETTQ